MLPTRRHTLRRRLLYNFQLRGMWNDLESSTAFDTHSLALNNIILLLYTGWSEFLVAKTMDKTLKTYIYIYVQISNILLFCNSKS